MKKCSLSISHLHKGGHKFLSILALGVFLLYSTNGIGQVIYDGNGTSVVGDTLPFTVPVGSDRLLVVSFCRFPGASSVTFNSIEATLAVENSGGIGAIAAIWYIPLGSGPAMSSEIITPSSTYPAIIGAASFQNIDQETPLGNTNESSFQYTDSPSLTVSSRPGNLIYDKFFCAESLNPVYGALQTPTFMATDEISDAGSSFQIATSDSTTMLMTFPYITSSWAYCAAEFHAALPAPVPTMSEWSYCLYGLVLISFSLVGLYNLRQNTALKE